MNGDSKAERWRGETRSGVRPTSRQHGGCHRRGELAEGPARGGEGLAVSHMEEVSRETKEESMWDSHMEEYCFRTVWSVWLRPTRLSQPVIFLGRFDYVNQFNPAQTSRMVRCGLLVSAVSDQTMPGVSLSI
jgi:hypothetical protein